MINTFREKKSNNEKDEKEEEAPVDEEEIENNIKEVNVIRSRVVAEKWIAPIDLSLTSMKNLKLHKLYWGNFTELPNKMKATNSGNTVILSAKWNHMRPHIRGGSLLSTYVFSQLHFHWGSSENEGSEHRLDSISYPLEMHVVFFKSLYLTQDVALTKEDGVVTVVYFFKLVSENNVVLNLITSKLAHIRQPHSSTSINPTPLSTLLHPFFEDYFMYWGKLQTTVCEHPVLWIISRHALGVTQLQLKEFRNLLGINDEMLIKNFRDPCPLNERPVFHVNPSSNLEMLLLPNTVKQDLQLVTVMYNYINECYNKYFTGSKNTNKKMCDELPKGETCKVILPGSEKLTNYDYVQNTMQSSGIKILFLLREITNILHQRILHGEANNGQNDGESKGNKENVTEYPDVPGYPNRDSDRRGMRIRNTKRNTEPSILMKSKLSRNKNVNNLLRLKQVSSRHTAISNKQNCLTKNKTVLSFNRPDKKLIQNDVISSAPADLSDCKHLFLPENNLKTQDEKLVSKIQTEVTRLNKLKQEKDKRPSVVQECVDCFSSLKREISKTGLVASDCRPASTVEDKNLAISNDFIPLRPSGNPCFKELSTIREESTIIKEENCSSSNSEVITVDKNKQEVCAVPMSNQIGVNVSSNRDNSQKTFSGKNEIPQSEQFCNIQILNDHTKLISNENDVFRVKKLAALGKQLMNVFHFTILPDNNPPVSYDVNKNHLSEQKACVEEDNYFLDTKEGTNHNHINNGNSVEYGDNRKDSVTVKNRTPMSINRHVVNQVQYSGIGRHGVAPVDDILTQQSDIGDSQLIQNKNYNRSSKKAGTVNELETEINDVCSIQCTGTNHLDMDSVHYDTINVKTSGTIENTSKSQYDDVMTKHLELMISGEQDSLLNKNERLDKVNRHEQNLIQGSVSTIMKLLTDEECSMQKESYWIESKALGMLGKDTENFIHDNMRKPADKSIVTQDADNDYGINSSFTNEMMSDSSHISQSHTQMDEELIATKENYESLKIKNSSNNFLSLSQHVLYFNQNNFEDFNVDHTGNKVYFNHVENHNTVNITSQEQEKNSGALSTKVRQAVNDISKEINNEPFSDKKRHSNNDNEKSCYSQNEHLSNDKQTIEQINEQILSLFENEDSNDNIHSECNDKVVTNAVKEMITEDNAVLPKQVTSLYKNPSFEDAATNPNSESSSRMLSVTSMKTDKNVKNKVAEQICCLQKHLYTAQQRTKNTEEPTTDRSNPIRRNTCIVHSNTLHKKIVSKNDSVKTSLTIPQAQNTRENISKIPKPIPVYAKAKRKLETKIPKPISKPGTTKEIKCFTQAK